MTVELILLAIAGAALLAVGLLWWRVPPLLIVLFAFAFVTRFKEGFQPEEIVFAGLYYGYIGYWFTSRLLDPTRQIVRTKSDLAILLFLIFAPSTFAISYLSGADVKQWLSEWVIVSMFFVYFPAREHCETHPNGVRNIVLSLGWIAGLTLVRNLWSFVSELQSATAIWQVATARVPYNEHLLMFAGLGSIVWFSSARTTTTKIAAFIASGLFSFGVLIGQSRAVWVSYALGTLFIILMRTGRARRRIVTGITMTVAVIVVAGLAIAPGTMRLLAVGLTSRVTSLENAVTNDLSLINRFHENSAVIARIRENPIVGHGMGTQYRYFSLVYESTYYTSFIHSWYVGFVFHFGLFGFVLFFPVYVHAIVRGSRNFLSSDVPRRVRLAGLVAASALVAEMLGAMTESTFGSSDKPLFVALLFALAFTQVPGKRSHHHSPTRLLPAP
ncbi:MAG: O-antigen ligase family protein [Bacteroidetes bacterium]|nr:O-antigen ligase family protein [Bacteroidota bacterium]